MLDKFLSAKLKRPIFVYIQNINRGIEMLQDFENKYDIERVSKILNFHV